MAEICCGVVSEACTIAAYQPSSRAARRKRMELRRFKFVGGAGLAPATVSDINEQKRQKLKDCLSRNCEKASESRLSDGDRRGSETRDISSDDDRNLPSVSDVNEVLPIPMGLGLSKDLPKFGVASVCGRRREMEDAVAVHPSLCIQHQDTSSGFHYFAVYDGHGCSHVAMRCRERLHELVREELASVGEGGGTVEWREAMGRSFRKMDMEVIAWNESVAGRGSCRCELQSPECDAVGSTAVVAIVTPDKIIVANCGDSRAVLSRKGKAVPLSSDHKPDRPDELDRIQSAGGRVIYWDGPRVLGVLAMSRAIGDNYLKPYVSCEPEVTVMERTPSDDCLIIASDGLWDVVSNDTACGVARMCLRGKVRAPAEGEEGSSSNTSPVDDSSWGEMLDGACSDASMLLMKLALARHSTDNVSVVVVDLRRSIT
ncbi:probable protein phosphatase 2C 24 [Punica granatum]|uniref:protein-serine/threonine phosphatase n=2 Tax=Punica granatum TaxID=22663 RepID=A0A218W8X7_PUNGR|nr:probable protein phosphatase 2C 24 [Punica granatum]OWM68780.1 hypothetical protein CDL15_Pgr024967 [Punica granatum]PKI66504.1 hypothetical protein CRG98_013160 [Punica granatum]